MLIALALVDANSGSGDPFTEQYLENFMPGPRDLATPFCQSAQGLEALQHPRVAEAALQRRKILDEAFPQLGNVYLGEILNDFLARLLPILCAVCGNSLRQPSCMLTS
jgi:hypothetical protein